MRVKRVVEAKQVTEYVRMCSPQDRREYNRMKKVVETNPVENTTPLGVEIEGYSLRWFGFGPHVAICTYDIGAEVVVVRECRRARP